MAKTEKPETNPEDLQKAQNLWDQFTVSMKYGIIATIVVLVLMAITLL